MFFRGVGGGLSAVPHNALGGDLIGTETEHGEHHQRGQHRREEVDEGHGVGIAVAVVALGIVGGVRDDGTEAQAQSEEDLRGRLPPHLHVSPDLQLCAPIQTKSWKKNK